MLISPGICFAISGMAVYIAADRGTVIKKEGKMTDENHQPWSLAIVSGCSTVEEREIILLSVCDGADSGLCFSYTISAINYLKIKVEAFFLRIQKIQ